MENRWDLDSIELDFLEDEKPKANISRLKPYKIMIADDNQEVHSVTKLMLQDFMFAGKKLHFIDTYSGSETEKMLRCHPDIAVLFLDVVMENHHSGLKVVEFLRKTLNNELTRVIIRTGQSGEVTEESIIRDYDVNDYRLKTDLTLQRLNSSLLTALGNYRNMVKIEKNQKNLEKIIQLSSDLFSHHSLDDFLKCILKQMGSLIHEDEEQFYIPNNPKGTQGFITFDQKNASVVVSATDKYSNYIGKNLYEIDNLAEVSTWIHNHGDELSDITYVANGLIIKKNGRNSLHSYIFLEGHNKLYDIDLIRLYMTNYNTALDNFIMNAKVTDTQKDIESLSFIVDLLD